MSCGTNGLGVYVVRVTSVQFRLVTNSTRHHGCSEVDHQQAEGQDHPEPVGIAAGATSYRGRRDRPLDGAPLR
eukprot:10195827-Heterocapsa_arctica.AAC.1